MPEMKVTCHWCDREGTYPTDIILVEVAAGARPHRERETVFACIDRDACDARDIRAQLAAEREEEGP
jgi:hypothetical protein